MEDELSRITISVPRVPPSINKRIRMNHWAYTTLRDAWKTDIYHLMGVKNKAVLNAWRQLREESGQKTPVIVRIEHKKMYDPDAVYGAAKTPIDCLVRLGYIRDDSEKYLELVVTQERSNTPQTVITIVGPE